jgi:flagellar motor switch/type III secretory pathway protein FliN
MADLRHILRLRVPLSVTLAQRKMPLQQLLRLIPGATIDFPNSVNAPLELLVNNKSIAVGQVVKSNDHLGLRLTRVGDAREVLRSLNS